MAYGLDVEEIYYTDHNRTDLGVLQTYSIKLDLADEKDFQIESPDFDMVSGGFWYIPDTEIGGIIDGFDVNSEEQKAEYTGRSFRGILNSVYINMEGDMLMVDGDVQSVVNSLIENAGENAFVVCDAPDTSEDVETDLDAYYVLFGTTLYEAITGAAASIGLNLVYQYKVTDKKLHITPVLAQDYTDYLMYSDVADSYFTVEVVDGVVNHLILTNVDEITHERRTIHLFTDENGEICPFCTKTVLIDTSDGQSVLCYEDQQGELQPLEDHHYILDRSEQLLSGIDEIAQLEESSGEVSIKYKKLLQAPADWAQNFGFYFYRLFEVNVDQSVSERWENYAAVESESFSLLAVKPADWNTNYSAYYERTYNQETGGWDYSAVAGTSTLDYNNVTKITKVPKDWKYHYSDYYYYLQPGSSEQLTQYSGVNKTKFIKLKSKPIDWSTNLNSYYKKAFTQVYLNKQSKKRKAELIKNCVKVGDAYYKSLEIPQGKKSLPFVKNKYYRASSYTVAPKFNKNNTYLVRTREVIPTWAANLYYKRTVTASAPTFVAGEVYEQIEDHYESMVLEGLTAFAELQKSTAQSMTLEDFEVNIGDTVGGRDEFTKTVIVKSVTNINITIENGLLSADYEVKGD